MDNRNSKFEPRKLKGIVVGQLSFNILITLRVLIIMHYNLPFLLYTDAPNKDVETTLH